MLASSSLIAAKSSKKCQIRRRICAPAARQHAFPCSPASGREATTNNNKMRETNVMMMMANNATHQAASRHKALVPAEQIMKLFENRNLARSGGPWFGTRACEKMVRGIFFLCGTHLQYTLFLIERGRTQKRVVTSISWRRAHHRA